MSHPEHGDTQAFDRLDAEGVHDRVEFDLIGRYRLPIKADFNRPIELRVGRDEQTPTLYLIRYPVHGDPADNYAVVQPETIFRSPGRGWIAERASSFIGIGREVSPQFDLGHDVSRRHALFTTESSESGRVDIENFGRNGTRVLVHPDDLLGEAVACPQDDWPAILG